MTIILAGSHKDPPQEQIPKTSRTMKLPKKDMQPGEIVLPTPVIRRARGVQLSSPMQQPLLADSGTTSRCKKRFGALNGQRTSSIISALELEMLPLRSRLSSVKISLYESILRALHSLLSATSEQFAEQKTNKSLMAMCLRKMPEYIGGLEDQEQQEAEEQGTKSTLQDSEVSNEIYEELVAMLPPSRGGCPELRVLVRAHGVRLIKDAITDDLLDLNFVVLLIELCSKTKSYTEAEELLEALLDLGVMNSGIASGRTRGMAYLKPKNVNSTFDEGRKLVPLKTLRKFASECGRSQFMLRQLSRLIAQQQLPLDWLSTKEFSSIWSGIIKRLSRDEVCDDAVSFAIHTIATLSTQIRNTIFSLKSEPTDLKTLSQQTLLSAITTITTLPLLQQEAGGLPTHTEQHNIIPTTSYRIQYIIQSCIHKLGRPRKPGWVSTVLNLAAYLTSTSHDSSSKEVILGTWSRIGDGRDTRDARQHHEAAAAFICSLVQCLGRGASEPSHTFLTKLLDRLDTALYIDEVTCRKLRVDCAFFLAERTHDLRDLAFAESFNASDSLDLNVASTVRKKSASSPSTRFRWDEGISEWVTATPIIRRSRSRSRRSLQNVQRDSTIETWHGTVMEEYDDYSAGVSDDDAGSDDSAKCITSKQRTEPIGLGTRASRARRSSERLKPTTTRSRKRSLASTGLAGLQSEDSDEDDDDDVSRGNKTRDGQENQVRATHDQSIKRHRAAALKPYRSILKTITNIRSADLSDDELCL